MRVKIFIFTLSANENEKTMRFTSLKLKDVLIKLVKRCAIDGNVCR